MATTSRALPIPWKLLFLAPTSPDLLAERFADVRAFGVAGISRAMGPVEMKEELLPIFTALKSIPTRLVHYKMCSTFDSSPMVGNIGKAIDIAAEVFTDQRYVSLLVGVPKLKRFTVFGNHYAAVGRDTYRLDRHPTMSRHPITRMDEADLRVLLARQTNRTSALLDLYDLEGDRERVRECVSVRMEEEPDILIHDVIDDERLKRSGELMWEDAITKGNRFVVGSSGVEYALVAYWRERGILDRTASLYRRGPVDRIFAVSGSCSPITEAQMKYALERGFAGVKIPVEKLSDPLEREAARHSLFEEASALLDQGKSPLLYTAWALKMRVFLASNRS